ncbi:hypothetical protein H0H87_004908 [Tephrocybe sp. NHM501043]|nr:hypothetical protein H0H87_004908 [Tephrocybe sp. NHM501043]
MGASTVKRRRSKLGLFHSKVMKKKLDPTVAEQIVINEMANDLSQMSGPNTIMNRIAHHTGLHITRKFIEDTMHDHDSEGFELREPTGKRIHRVKKFPIGIHHRWSADGHDKLYKIGFPVWAIVEDATSKWLNAWVVPSNRTGDIIAYLWLCNVEKYGERFHPELDADEIPPHVYVRSIHNISVERSWLRLRLDIGDTIVLAFNKGIEDVRVDNSDHALQRVVPLVVVSTHSEGAQQIHGDSKWKQDAKGQQQGWPFWDVS